MLCGHCHSPESGLSPERICCFNRHRGKAISRPLKKLSGDRLHSDSAPGMGSRVAANRALSECLRRKRPLDAALEESTIALPARDSGFARAIANETMRRFGQLEDLLRRFVPRP